MRINVCLKIQTREQLTGPPRTLTLPSACFVSRLRPMRLRMARANSRPRSRDFVRLNLPQNSARRSTSTRSATWCRSPRRAPPPEARGEPSPALTPARDGRRSNATSASSRCLRTASRARASKTKTLRHVSRPSLEPACSGARGTGAAGDALCAQDASQVADLILSECWALLERHRALPAEWYNDDGQYKTALLEVAGIKDMAMHKFLWWSEQTYVFIFSLRTKTMTQVNRSHIGSLQAAYQRAKAAGDAHAVRGAAEQLLRETGQTHSAGVNEAVGVDGDTALGVAAADGDERSVALLLDAEADTDRCNAAGFSPLVGACCNGHRECARLLLLARADVDLPTVPTPPHATRRPARYKATLYPARCKATLYPSAKRRKMGRVLLKDARCKATLQRCSRGEAAPPQEAD